MNTMLERRDLWNDDDHLTDAALSALADGQIAVIPADATTHAETCAPCSERLATLAILASEAQVVLAPVLAERTRTVRRFPVALVLAALVLAAIGAAPSLADRTHHALAIVIELPELVPHMTSAGSVLARALTSGPLGAAVTFSVFVVLALSGALIARSARTRGALS
ncbi:hypothetical protein BH09MYX1_BH09MYX1_66940 [soil metagenome]